MLGEERDLSYYTQFAFVHTPMLVLIIVLAGGAVEDGIAKLCP